MGFELKELSIKNGEVEYRYIYKVVEAAYDENKVYGIEVIRNDVKNDTIVNIEKNEIKLISPNIEKVKGLLKILYEGLVSPIHLIDIIGEEVDKCVFDF